MSELKSCPFCGSPGVAEKPHPELRGFSVLVGCSNKECRLGSVAFDSVEEWNHRADEDKPKSGDAKDSEKRCWSCNARETIWPLCPEVDCPMQQEPKP